MIFFQDAFALRANQRSPISANLPIWSHRQNLGLNSMLPLTDSDPTWDSYYSHLGWETVSSLLSLTSIPLRKKTTGARDCIPPQECMSNLSLKSGRYLSTVMQSSDRGSVEVADSLSVHMCLEERSRTESRAIVCYLSGIWRRLEPLMEWIYSSFALVDPSSHFAGVPW